jgi:lipopolysaccharide/colanic/teichoic acid biosynthesis glycosyltransferase
VIEAKTDEIWWPKIKVETVHRTRVAEPRALLYPTAKRWIDIICTVVLLVLLSPLMALIALAIRLDSSGSAIFRQKRVGKWGKQFTMFKFRSMHADADEEVHRKFASDYINGNGHKKTENSSIGDDEVYKPNGDKRITRVGQWLRRTSLDELPQLLNVLRGEMSLVGPRPVVPYEVEEYSRWHLRRLAVLPGMTGLAQINGRSASPFEKIVRLDLLYIRRRSLALDMLILWKTIPVVLKAEYVA